MEPGDWESNECQKICEPGLKLQPPFCKARKYAPDYHQICRCLVAYKCCTEVCEPIDDTVCDVGTTIPRETIDCCGCPKLTCVECPTPDAPECNTQCEALQVITESDTGCRVPICEKRCPKIESEKCD